jgi:hypothetical protein
MTLTDTGEHRLLELLSRTDGLTPAEDVFIGRMAPLLDDSSAAVCRLERLRESTEPLTDEQQRYVDRLGRYWPAANSDTYRSRRRRSS